MTRTRIPQTIGSALERLPDGKIDGEPILELRREQVWPSADDRTQALELCAIWRDKLDPELARRHAAALSDRSNFHTSRRSIW